MNLDNFKIDNPIFKNYFKIFDLKGKKLKITFLFLVILLYKAIFTPVKPEYLQLIKCSSIVNVDILYDYIVPLVLALIICYIFYSDYKNKEYELLTFYNRGNINYNVFYRWLIHTLLYILGSFITAMIYYRTVSFLDKTNLLLSLRFIPSLVFLCSLSLFLIIYIKKINIVSCILILYCVLDYVFLGKLGYCFSIGANINNFYYKISPQFFFINRISLLFIGIVLVYIACKKAIRI
ncbi:hypothetical protein [Hathewaya limosa]|uniref:Magnesium-transporting ATPase (P-type) n=1 Tax=Hathewaya limosa TaxID=1536 RepID=A0ABU0JPN4_HATLI|nr:hypothetical protein [Hathewaya limosa]MDQ0479038.1 magnesium-transporting ATPase (P-type) [Hathewaya limosa]